MATHFKNIVFDLGGVLFARDPRYCTPEMVQLFKFIRTDPMPQFWVEYDRGTLTVEEALAELVRMSGLSYEHCKQCLEESIARQATIAPTERLIRRLKDAGYKLYVLSNMSREFIAFLRRFDVYRCFDGEVVSCEEGTVKPEKRIFDILLERYNLDKSTTLFIDDRRTNIAAARELGINGYKFDAADPETSCRELETVIFGM